MKRSRILIGCLLLLALPLHAQSDDFGMAIGVGVKKKIARGWNLLLNGEYRTHDGLSQSDRWEGGAAVDYRVASWLKAEAGYTYIRVQSQEETTAKGNLIPPYWLSKHRLNGSLTGSVSWNRFTFSLRERWQYDYHPEKYVAKYAGDGITAKDDELVKGSGKNRLRSRIGVAYNMAKCPVTPAASFELYNTNKVEKIRVNVGADYKLDKRNSFEVYYRYLNKKVGSEANKHLLGIRYQFKF